MNKIQLQCTKNIAMVVKCFSRDTIVFSHKDSQDFLRYKDNVQSKELIGITCIDENQFNFIKPYFADIVVQDNLIQDFHKGNPLNNFYQLPMEKRVPTMVQYLLNRKVEKMDTLKRMD